MATMMPVTISSPTSKTAVTGNQPNRFGRGRGAAVGAGACRFTRGMSRVLAAARLKDAGRPYAVEAAKAKLFATDMAMRVTTDAVQVLGGYGYVSDHPVERYMREAKVLQIVEGTNQIQRLVIAKSL